MADSRTRKLEEMTQRQVEMVQQLRAEKRLERQPVTATISDMISFMESQAVNDFLLIGFHKPSDNPFHEKGKCTII
ncbi:hypothetical protein ACOMHN_059857 [Nucella lapillus]